MTTLIMVRAASRQGHGRRGGRRRGRAAASTSPSTQASRKASAATTADLGPDGGGQGRHEDPLADAQAPRQDRDHEPGHRRQRHAGGDHRPEPDGATPDGTSARITATWLRPSKIQPASDQSRPSPSSRRVTSGSASGPTPGKGRLTRPDSLGKTAGSTTIRNASPRPRLRSASGTGMPSPADREHERATARREPGGRDQAPGGHHHQRLVQRGERGRRRPRPVGRHQADPHHDHHRLARDVLAQVADQIRPDRRGQAQRGGARPHDPPEERRRSRRGRRGRGPPRGRSRPRSTRSDPPFSCRSCQVRTTCRPTAQSTRAPSAVLIASFPHACQRGRAIPDPSSPEDRPGDRRPTGRSNHSEFWPATPGLKVSGHPPP